MDEASDQDGRVGKHCMHQLPWTLQNYNYSTDTWTRKTTRKVTE